MRFEPQLVENRHRIGGRYIDAFLPELIATASATRPAHDQRIAVTRKVRHRIRPLAAVGREPDLAGAALYAVGLRPQFLGRGGSALPIWMT